MSHMLDFPLRPLPPNLNFPPYVIFGINGTDVTSALPPHIPLQLVLHFAPTLRKWVLPVPTHTCLPRSAMQYALHTPSVGIDIRAPIEAAGLCWILTRMLHLAGITTRREAFNVFPDLIIALAIHNAWLALELPYEGLTGLHMHVTTQLLIGSPAVGLADMQRVWAAFPSDSKVVWAMGLNFTQACAEGGYEAREGIEMAAWFQSTAELWGFLKSLQTATPMPLADGETQIPILAPEEKEKPTTITGLRTIGRKAGRAIKSALVAATRRQSNPTQHQAPPRDPSPAHRRQAREGSDLLALKQRLRRTQSDGSMRSLDTAIWIPREFGAGDGAAGENPEQEEGQEEEEEEEKEEERETTAITMPSLSTLLNDPINDLVSGYVSSHISDALETIRRRREARLARGRSLG
ncbi:hypothetical protein ST47_g4209 [Ascochyta rabiei]|uniref:Uncharacterized protein n=1 Tax=Didymella rabiei TaxID=5454 RepID=A0A163FZU0_DIDRA|nr:hypothetical protein ST47_g4209 [Ascochyta rabiei]